MALVIDILFDSSRPEIFRKMCSVWAMFTSESARDKIEYNTVDLLYVKYMIYLHKYPNPYLPNIQIYHTSLDKMYCFHRGFENLKTYD